MKLSGPPLTKRTLNDSQPPRGPSHTAVIRNWVILGIAVTALLSLLGLFPRPLDSFVDELPFNARRLTIYTSAPATLEPLLAGLNGQAGKYRLVIRAQPPEAKATATPSLTMAVTYAPQPTADISQPADLARVTRYACSETLFAGVNFTNPLTSITRDQLLGLLDGSITSWDALGWDFGTIKLFLPDPSSTISRRTTLGGALPTNAVWYSDLDQVAATLRSDPAVLALLPAAGLLASPDLRHLSIDGVSPLKSSIDMASYPLVTAVSLAIAEQAKTAIAQQLLSAIETEIDTQGYQKTCYQDLITIKAVGDMMLSRHVNTMMVEANDRKLPFLKTASFISDADLTFGNLESPFYDQGPVISEGMSFKAEPESIEGLLLGGIDIVDLANNHFGNQGRSGMNYTFDYLPANGIQYYGAGRNYAEAHTARIMLVDGKRIGFLGYDEISPESYSADESTPGFAWEERQSVQDDIAAALPLTDFLIVSFHWGVEYTPHPTSVQQQFAHLAIDSGADMIISHHPHVVQATEWYNGKFIAYSLGNFVFDQMWSTETQQGLIASFSLTRSLDPESQHLVPLSIDLIPIRIANFNQPAIADQTEANQILERVFDASADL